MRALSFLLALVLVGGWSGPALTQPRNCQLIGTDINDDTRFAAISMIVPQNDRCEARAGNRLSGTREQTPPRNGRLEFSGGNFTYIPNPGYVGDDSFVVSVAREQRRIAVTVTVSVVHPRAMPPASTQAQARCQYQGAAWGPGARFAAATMSVPQNGQCTHQITNFHDMRIETPPQNGRVQGGGGSMTYFPNPGFAGSDSYIYSAAPPGGGVRVRITVSVSVVP